MKDNSRYMFDTVAFNRALDTDGAVELLSRSAHTHMHIFATHVQWDELANTSDCDRRSKLLSTFEAFVPKEEGSNLGGKIPTESAAWNVSDWNEAKWRPDDGLYEVILSDLNQCRKKPNNVQDALIAETAIQNNLALVTDDCNLATITNRHGGRALSFEHLMQRCRS